MVVHVGRVVAVVRAIRDLFRPRKRNKKKKSKKKISPKHKKGNKMKPLNQKRLRRILADNPSADWFDVREVRLTEKKKPKHQNRFKALYVCARYWAKQLDCEARAIVVEPSNGETYPKAVLQLRPRRAPKQIETVAKLTANLEALIAEVDKLTELAEQMNVLSAEMARKATTKQANNLDELLDIIEADIRNRRLSAEIKQAWNERPAPAPRVRKDFE